MLGELHIMKISEGSEVSELWMLELGELVEASFGY